MTLSPIRVALILPLAFGCAHAVYDGQPDLNDTGNAITDRPTMNAGAGTAGATNSLPNNEQPDAGESAGSTGNTGGAPSSFAGETGNAGTSAAAGAGNSAGSAGTSASGGAAGSAAGGATGSAGAPTNSAGSSSGGASAGSSSGGAASGGAASGGAPAGGSTGTGNCSGVSTWMKGSYESGDKVQAGGKLYQCKQGAEHGWCGIDEAAYAPGTGSAWASAWDLVGPC